MISFWHQLPMVRTTVKHSLITLLTNSHIGTLKIWNLKTTACIRTIDCGHAICSLFLPGDRQASCLEFYYRLPADADTLDRYWNENRRDPTVRSGFFIFNRDCQGPLVNRLVHAYTAGRTSLSVW